MLEVEDIHTYISDSYILQGVSIEVQKGTIVGVLGRNGVGKTTLIHSIVGFRHAKRGSIRFEGNEITHLPTHKIMRLGVGLVPQGRRVFRSLTVLENLQIPFRCASELGESLNIETMFQLFPSLKERRDERAGKLSGGEQQMVSTARALISRPKLLLMDEPSEGLAPVLVRNISQTLKDLKGRGLTILLVEQRLSFVLDVADYVYVMSKGRVVYHATPAELWQNEEVKSRYLGI